MKKWEYLVVRFDLEELDSQGKAGWELVAVSGDYFFFKRELSTPTGEEFANSKAEGKGAGMSLNNLDAIELRMALESHESVADQWITEVSVLQSELQRYKDALKITKDERDSYKTSIELLAGSEFPEFVRRWANKALEREPNTEYVRCRACGGVAAIQVAKS